MKFCTKIKTILVILFLTLISTQLIAQTQSDTSSNRIKIDIKYTYWNLRIATGFQKSHFVDLGISHSYFLGSPQGMSGYDIFSSFIYHPSYGKNDIKGVKIGSNFFGNLGLLGLELGYYSSGAYSDLMITPKIGMGISSFYFTYGYNFSTNEYFINRLGKHQFTVVANLPFYRKNKLTQKSTSWFKRSKKV